MSEPCYKCDGKGAYYGHTCDECDGTGRVDDDRDQATAHVVVDTMDGGAFVCTKCGDRYRMNLPCPIDVYVAASQAFVRNHKGCNDG